MTATWNPGAADLAWAFGQSELAAELYCNEALDGKTFMRYLDSVGSVSALDEDEDPHVWDDQLLEQQYRRFLDGS